MDNTARVLIVDDEAHVRRALTRVLRQAPIDVDAVESANEALHCLEQQDYHLIISDLKMPETDGIELLTLVSELYPQTSRMLLSGHADRDDLNNAINQCRVDQYLDKPWDNQQLIATINEVTEQNQRQRTELAETRTMDRELNAAMKLQLSALPEEIDRPDFKVRWMFQACYRLGGDGINYWMQDNKLHFFLIDVAGHGASAAMESFALQHMLNHRDLSDPAAVTRELNENYLFLDEPLRYFTMLSGCLDLATRTLTYCQAGHPAPLRVSRSEFMVHRCGEGGFPVGMLEHVPYENQTLTLGADDMLILHSDGLAEHHCENFEGFLLINSDMQPAGLADKVIAWRSNNLIDDDISALFITLPDAAHA